MVGEGGLLGSVAKRVRFCPVLSVSLWQGAEPPVFSAPLRLCERQNGTFWNILEHGEEGQSSTITLVFARLCALFLTRVSLHLVSLLAGKSLLVGHQQTLSGLILYF